MARLLRVVVVFGVAVVFVCLALDAWRMRQELRALRGDVKGIAAHMSTSVESLNDAQRFLANIDIGKRQEYGLASVPPGQSPIIQQVDDEGGIEQNRRAQLTMDQAQANVLAAYHAESSDASWAGPAQRMLESEIRRTLPSGSRLQSVDCRTSLCLVEVQHSDRESGQQFLHSAFHDWPGALLVASEREERGTIVQQLIPIRENTVPPYEGVAE